MASNGWNVSDAAEAQFLSRLFPLSVSTTFYRLCTKPVYHGSKTIWKPKPCTAQNLQFFTSLDVVMQDRTEKIFSDKLGFFMRELRLPTDPGMQAGAVLIDPAIKLPQSYLWWRYSITI